MTFARVNDEHPVLPRRGENLPQWRHDGLQARYIVAERLAKTARLKEVALHVDDHQRSAFEIDGQRCRFSLEGDVWHFQSLNRHEDCD